MAGTEGEHNNPLHAENLKRWLESGEPQKWIREHPAPHESDWTVLSKQLRASTFWPMDETSIYRELFALADISGRPAVFRSSNFRKPVVSYAAGLAMVGAAGGFFAGASSTPIVSALLPLFFALIGGSSGIYLATADLQSQGVSWRIEWIGKALAIFSASFFVFTLIGIGARTGFRELHESNELAQVSYQNVQNGLQLAVLRSKLRILDVPPAEQKRILKMAAQELESEATPLNPGSRQRHRCKNETGS